MNITVETFEKAIAFAIKAHKGQYRKGNGRPYILHPMSVMLRLYENKRSANMFLLGTAAILHDTVEDCGVTLNTIAKKFGYPVAALVEELTLDKSKYKTIGKAEYIAQEALKMSSYALTIKLCDRLDNVCDLEDMSDDFRKKYIIETEHIIETIVTQRKQKTETHYNLIKQIENKLLSLRVGAAL